MVLGLLFLLFFIFLRSFRDVALIYMINSGKPTNIIWIPAQKRGKEEGEGMQLLRMLLRVVYITGAHIFHWWNLVKGVATPDYQGGCDMSLLDRESYASPKTWAKTWGYCYKEERNDACWGIIRQSFTSGQAS